MNSIPQERAVLGAAFTPELAFSLINLPRIADERGCLSFVEGGRHIPFDIRRVYYIYGLSAGAARGGHAHRECERVLIPIAGEFVVWLDDGRQRSRVVLDDPAVGLYVPAMVWLDLTDFQPGSVCLALASSLYTEADYIRDYGKFQRTSRAPLVVYEAEPADALQ
jgi:dTDP-4-dehydrorhamnose 3,5-epimerase-like enzyme